MTQYNAAARREAIAALQQGGGCDVLVNSWELSRTVAAAITGKSAADPETFQLARMINSSPIQAKIALTLEQKRAVLDAVQAFFPQDAADRLAGPPTRQHWNAIRTHFGLQS